MQDTYNHWNEKREWNFFFQAKLSFSSEID